MSVDIGLHPSLLDILDDVGRRVYDLEQRLTNPEVAVGSGSTPYFPSITIGASGGTTVLSNTVSPPTNLVTATGSFYENIYIDASWTAPADGSATEYEVVFAKKVSGVYQTAMVRQTLSTAFRFERLEPNTTYGIQVRSINRVGLSSTPLPGAGYTDVTTGVDATLPAQVTGLVAAAGATSVTLSWNESTDPDVKNGAGMYEVQYGTSNVFSGAASRKVAATVVSITGLTTSTTYYFRVRAIDASGNEGTWSTTAQATIGSTGANVSDGAAPASSPQPTVTAMLNSLIARWTPVANADPVTYEVHISTSSGFTPVAGTKVAEIEGSFAIIRTDAAGAALVYGTTYYVRLVAKDKDGSAAAGTQGSGQIAQVGANDVVADSITAAQIATDTITANEIATNTITANEIAANTITANEIAANTLTANEIQAGAIGADEIAAGVITAGKMVAGTLTANEIAANSVTVDRLTTSTLAARTITLGSAGQIVVGNPGGGAGTYGLLINDQGLRLYNGTTQSITLDALTGNATFRGTITASAIDSTSTITGATITGGTIRTASSGRRVEMGSTIAGGQDQWAGAAAYAVSFYPLGATNKPAQIFLTSSIYGTSYGSKLSIYSGQAAASSTYSGYSYIELDTGNAGSAGISIITATNGGLAGTIEIGTVNTSSGASWRHMLFNNNGEMEFGDYSQTYRSIYCYNAVKMRDNLNGQRPFWEGRGAGGTASNRFEDIERRRSAALSFSAQTYREVTFTYEAFWPAQPVCTATSMVLGSILGNFVALQYNSDDISTSIRIYDVENVARTGSAYVEIIAMR